MNSFIHTPTNSLEESIGFYEKLNYKRISSENFTWFTNGQCVVEINPDRHARSGIKLYKNSWAEEISLLKKTTSVLKPTEPLMN